MKRSVRLTGSLASMLLIAGGSAVAVGGAVAIVTTEPAAAGTNFGLVQNEAGSPVKAYCNYDDKSAKTIYERIGGKTPYKSGTGSKDPCGADTDQVEVTDSRCVQISTTSGGPRTGDYLMTPGARYKIQGTEMWWIYARTTGKKTDYQHNCTNQAPLRGA